MKFTYYTIIGKDKNLLRGHLKNVKEYAGFDKLKGEKEIIVVVYTNPSIDKRTTLEIIDLIEKNGARAVIYKEPTTNFLYNLYACWNLGYHEAEEGYVFRGGSDQIFSKNSFLRLYEVAENYKNSNVILQANTIENPKRAIGSRHILADLGDTYENFKFLEFENLCEQINSKTTKETLNIQESLSTWGKPTSFNSSLGRIDRTDGCSWLMKKSDWIKYGPLPPIEFGITGDVVIHDRMQVAGYENFIVNGVNTYHFVQGESKHSNAQEI